MSLQNNYDVLLVYALYWKYKIKQMDKKNLIVYALYWKYNSTNTGNMDKNKTAQKHVGLTCIGIP